MIRTLLTAAALFVAALAGHVGDVQAQELTLYERHAFERQLWGLQPLAWDPALSAAAQERAEYMARTGEFSHYPSNGRTGSLVASAYGFGRFWIGENINRADGGESTFNVMTSFVNSPAHRAIIHHGGMSRIGIGVAYSSSGARYTAVLFAGQW